MVIQDQPAIHVIIEFKKDNLILQKKYYLKDVGGCLKTLCQNGGTCSQNTGICSCSIAYSGTSCQNCNLKFYSMN